MNILTIKSWYHLPLVHRSDNNMKHVLFSTDVYTLSVGGGTGSFWPSKFSSSLKMTQLIQNCRSETAVAAALLLAGLSNVVTA